ncbi:MAG: hypothetical protein JWO47_3 [Candidatus Saccharibacteria bacterium]|nr:hypothetical protein [Candidatus Saccharibacteria bacterium]
MAITKRMGEIYKLYESGLSADLLAARYNISKNSVLKKVKIVDAHLNQVKILKATSVSVIPKKQASNLVWNEEKIKAGIENFRREFGRIPTSRDFDEVTYLPSARQVQRAYGGLVTLRKTLGYDDTDFTRGDLRKLIATNSNKRGLSAEDDFEPLLVAKFGEPFVHVQKRYYKGSKNRYDFLVYAKNAVCGIDIFATDRSFYIEKNLRHKILRYKNAPSSLDIYFVLMGSEYTPEDVKKAAGSISELSKYSNMKPVHESEFFEIISQYEPLEIPDKFYGLEDLEDLSINE